MHRRGAARSPTTGSPLYDAPVTVDAKIESYTEHAIASDRTIQDAKYRVTLYETAVGTGDRLTWDGGDHEVLKVRGLLQNVGGSRYGSRAVVN